jgi:hypothetical protein
MPWDQVGARRYYYRSERVAGRPVRRYIGTGPAAELAATADDLRRLERAIAVQEQKAEQARRCKAEAPLLELCAVTDILARLSLVATGHYRHDRGAWRRRREVT